jgi:uncharacterized protein (TIGR03790 family)
MPLWLRQFQQLVVRVLLRVSLTLLLSIGLVVALLVGPWLGALEPPPRRVDASTLGVVVNQASPLSQAIGAYYQQRRRIPQRNMIYVSFDPAGTTLTPEQFAELKGDVDRQTPRGVQAFALTWAAPYRVGCMSITSAFAFGFDKAYCAQGCVATKASPYFNSGSKLPYVDFKVRPTMAIAAQSILQAKALIDRGVESDGTRPRGTGYFLTTSDADRTVRSALYPMLEKLGPGFKRELIKADQLRDRSDVMAYFTGTSDVKDLTTNRFLPGAIADHLTSWGGALTDSGQMSSLRWLEAGATGSYGSVEEPCNFLQKFPHPVVAVGRYLMGDTLIEAYWKSVAWPGQGIFIGEPLARPFGKG